MMPSAEEFARRVLTELQTLHSGHLSLIERTAEAMARRVLRGGRLYIFDDHNGLTSEAVGRAGGLMMIQPLSTADLAKAGIAGPDILIMCSRRADNTAMAVLARDARQRGVYVVALCPTADKSDALTLTHWASAHLRVPLDGGIFTTSDGKTVCPVSGGVACVVLWMLTAALIEGTKVVYIGSPVETRIVPSQHPSGKRVADVVDLVICTHVPYTDGVIDEAWLPTPACPLSGFANTLVFWMLNAEVLRLLERRRK